jgi:hypothetical protein
MTTALGRFRRELRPDSREGSPWISQQTETGRVAHRLEPIMFVLALLVTPVVLIEESTAPHALKTTANGANWVIWIGFTLEFLAILVVAPGSSPRSGRIGFRR